MNKKQLIEKLIELNFEKMPRRKSSAKPASRRAPAQQKRPASTLPARPAPPPTKPANQTNVPAVPSKQPTSLGEQRSPGLFGQVNAFSLLALIFFNQIIIFFFIKFCN